MKVHFASQKNSGILIPDYGIFGKKSYISYMTEKKENMFYVLYDLIYHE